MALILSGDTGPSFVQSAAMPVGSVLQVVNGSYGIETYNSTNTFTDTGLTVTITPKSATSTILVLVNQAGVQKNTNNLSIQIRLYRNGTYIAKPANEAAYTNSTMVIDVGSVSMCYLDSPATTSALTYKTQFASNDNSAQARVQGGNSLSTITVMEIAV